VGIEGRRGIRQTPQIEETRLEIDRIDRFEVYRVSDVLE
jgi:hypothetical protein